MDRRQFVILTAGVAGATAAAGAFAQTPVPGDALGGSLSPSSVQPRRTLRVGGDYHAHAGDSALSQENIDFNLRNGVRFLTVNMAKGVAPLNKDAKGHPDEAGWLRPTGPWDLAGLQSMQQKFNDAGIKLEGARMDSAYIVMKPGPERERYVDLIRDNIRKAAAAGFTTVNYHWTMIPIRRNLKVPGRGDSTYVGFKLEDDYLKLPATPAAGNVSLADYWERIEYFLKAVIPVAKENNIKMAVHPYDPGGLPLGYQGVDNWDSVDFIAAMKKYELLYDDPHNGFQYDTGVAAESIQNPNAQLGLLEYLVKRGKVHQIHLRNIRGHQNDFVETYHDEGDIDLFAIVRLLKNLNWEGSLLPDHTPVSPTDPGRLQGYAFAYGYIAGLINAAYAQAG